MRPWSASGSGSPAGATGEMLIVSAARSMASMSWPVSAGAATTSRTPARSACCSIWVESSCTTMMAATSGRLRVSFWTSLSPAAAE